MHATLEQIRPLRIAAKSVPEFSSALLADFKARFADAVSELGESAKARLYASTEVRVKAIENGIIRVARDVFMNAAPSDAAAFNVEVPLTSTDGKLFGILDRVDRSNNRVRIIDYKSSLEATEKAIARARDQILFYAFLWLDYTGSWPDSGLAWFISANRSINIDIDQAASLAIADEILGFVAGLDAFNSMASDEVARPGEDCAYCSYRPWCNPFWDAQRISNSLAGMRAGISGLVVSQTIHDGSCLIKLRSGDVYSDVRFEVDYFPQLINLAENTMIRVVSVEVAGTVGRPSIFLNERSEAFIVD